MIDFRPHNADWTLLGRVHGSRRKVEMGQIDITFLLSACVRAWITDFAKTETVLSTSLQAR